MSCMDALLRQTFCAMIYALRSVPMHDTTGLLNPYDSRFSGGNLVSMQPEDLAALLASFAVDLATRTER